MYVHFCAHVWIVKSVPCHILQVNTQLYSAREKEDLAELIRIMITYNMTYNQEKTPEGQYVYVLDP